MIYWMNETELDPGSFFLKSSRSLHAFRQFFTISSEAHFQVVIHILTSENSILFALLVHCYCINDLFPFSVYIASKFYTKIKTKTKLLTYNEQSLSYSVENGVSSISKLLFY